MKRATNIHAKGALLIIIIAASLLSGCSPLRAERANLEVQAPKTFLQSLAAGSDDGASTKRINATFRWWESFSDDELNRLMEEAFEGNLTLAMAYARMEQFIAVTRAVGSSAWPSLTIEGQGQRSSSDSDSTRNTTTDSPGASVSLGASVAASYEIDLWFKSRSKRKAAAFEARASMHDLMTLYITLSSELAERYYISIEERAKLKLTDDTIASFEDTLKRVERRYEAGLVGALDVYQARQNLSLARARRPMIEATLASTEHAISVLLGRYPTRTDGAVVSTLPRIKETFPEGLPSELLIMRPDVQSALLRLKSSDKEVAAAIADRFPSLNLIGNYGTLTTIISSVDVTTTYWNVIAGIVAPIIDGGRRRAEVKRRKAIFKERLYSYKLTVLTAFKEVEDALIKNRASEERLSALEDRAEATKAALRISTERYMQGITDYLPVLTAQSLNFEAEIALLTARRQLISERIGLARALGGRWMETEIIKKSKGQIS